MLSLVFINVTSVSLCYSNVNYGNIIIYIDNILVEGSRIVAEMIINIYFRSSMDLLMNSFLLKHR